ncbi:hypothetical protein QTP86_009918 [Hemibagrus guttatus]|nr:hypothetical protein QTP86_009918 [Hemibagrus guttatus]
MLLLLMLALSSLVHSAPVLNTSLPLDCEDVYNFKISVVKNASVPSGVYTIYPAGSNKPVKVYCDMGCLDNSGHQDEKWTVIQRRINGSVSFYRPWAQYKEGFGDPAGEYWLGLENIFLMTNTERYQLRVDMEDFEKGSAYAQYTTFTVNQESTNYMLNIEGYINGGAGDSLFYVNGRGFSTYDKDPTGNCAETNGGGFWYYGYWYWSECHNANPNGLYNYGNVGTASTGKGRELADMLDRRKVDILCVQETRWKGSKARSIGAGFKLFYYGVDSKRNGVGVVLKEEFVRNVLEVKRVSDRVMSLKLEIEGVMLNVVSGYAPQVGCELEEKERFWSELDEVMESIPTGERVVIGADFNGHVGEGNTGDEEVMGKFGVKERNLEGQMVVDFAKRMDMAVVNTYFQKREEHRVTYKSGGRRTQVDYILCRRGNLKEIIDCKVVVGESVARQHRMVVCRMTLMVCKKKRSEIEKKTKWWKLKKEECCEEFRQKLRQALGGQVVLPDDWETTAEVIRETGRKVLGVSSGRRKENKKTWWWNEKVQDSIQRKRLAKKKWDMDRTEENRQEYKEQKVDKIRKDEVRKTLKRMKSGKAVGPDDIPVEVWKCLGEAAVEFLTSLFNRVLESERMPEEWRRSVLVPIFKNEGDVQSCSNYRGIKLMNHTMKLWERVVESRLRKVVEICEQQYGFMPRKNTTDAIFALRILMKYRDGQRELHCVFVDLEKAYDRVPSEELWYCMRKSGVAEKYVRVVQDMYERSRTVVRCAVGQTEEFKVEVGLHQGSALSPFLFAIVMDQLSEEVRQESPWTMMFADGIVICSESREQVEENLERWRFALERRGMKVKNQGEGVQDSGETGHAVRFRDSVTEEETGVRARVSVTSPINLFIIVIYRPPGPLGNFLDEMDTLLSVFPSDSTPLTVLGDFKLPSDKLQSSGLLALLNSFSLSFNSCPPTHKEGNVLDLVFTHPSPATDMTVTPLHISDHHLLPALFHLFLTMNPSPPFPWTQLLTFCFPPFPQPWTFSALCLLYTGRILLLLLGCQTCFATIRENYDQQWKWKWKKSNLDTDLISYRTLLSKFSLDVTSAKTSFYKEKLETSAQDPRKLNNIFSSLLNPPAPPSPSSLTTEDFATFFTEKIERICQTFTSLPTSPTSHSQHSATPSLMQLSTVASEEVLQITRSCNPTTCPLDPIPSAMLQTISPDLLPFITTVINGSLTSGHVPTAFKKARVIPILKKPALDPSDISNYRPVSLLSFLSKILERIVCNQLSDYLMQNNLHDPNQSGFKAAHFTETALLAVTEKLHAARSAKLSSVLILLDLSAAFDTVNHKTLLSTLTSLGICGTA